MTRAFKKHLTTHTSFKNCKGYITLVRSEGVKKSVFKCPHCGKVIEYNW